MSVNFCLTVAGYGSSELRVAAVELHSEWIFFRGNMSGAVIGKL
ncbi:hypothetical protein [uncultured Victivallis sp.]|nr:hypothetical protein [uncultured Victivallis sp.]